MPTANRQPDTVPTSDKEKYGEWYPQFSLLSSTLSLAVPLWIERLRRCEWEHVQERAKVCSDHIAEHGDNLMFRSKKKGGTAEAFNCLAEGLACLSFAPGGVKVFGGHWEAVLDADVAGRSTVALTGLLEIFLKVLKGFLNNADSKA